MIFLKKSLFLLCLFLCACVGTLENPTQSFGTRDTVFQFDENDNPVEIDIKEFLSQKRDTFIPKINTRLNDAGEFEVFETDTGKILFKSNIGERTMLCATDNQNFYFLSNANTENYHLLKYSLKDKKFITIGKRDACLESAHFDNQNGKISLAILSYNDNRKIYFSEKFKRAEEKIFAEFSSNKIHWSEKVKHADKWLVTLYFKNRPEKNIVYDFEKKSITPLRDQHKNWRETTRREEIFFKARDGTSINAVLTWNKNLVGKKNLPLVVFPHGGPASKSDVNFDFRAHILAEAGFLVVQPNYRSSEWFGKSFRFAGMKPEGIKKSQQDIEDCVKYLISTGVADKDKIAIFGGSWGGFCTAYALAFTPQYYKAGVVFFGVFDIVEMLKSPNIPCNKALDSFQYGELPKDELALKSISPQHYVKNIKAPITIYHFKNDTVIDYAQSENFVAELKALDKKFEFITGAGEHGFESDKAEHEAYLKMIKFFKREMNLD